MADAVQNMVVLYVFHRMPVIALLGHIVVPVLLGRWSEINNTGSKVFQWAVAEKASPYRPVS